MADIVKLRNEIINDPIPIGYSSLNDQQVTDSLNDSTLRTRNRTILSASEVMNQIDITEFNALTTVQERQVWDVLHIGNINPFGVEATIFTSIFGGSSTTISNLQAARTETISRATELGLGKIAVGEVTIARS